ncbi:MAG: thioesterase family protein [Anaerolineae bacterium]|jgi:acyl-CoA thioester hydrolase|nr:thioesterase family protein [Anaerolineae bacterium]
MIALHQLEILPTFFRVTVGEEAMDAMGHMNVRWYAGFFDEGTWALMDRIGLTQAYWLEKQAGMAALEQHIRYYQEVRLGENILIKTRLLARSAKRIHFMHFMVNESKNGLAATSELVATHMDLAARRSSAFADVITQQLDDLLTQHQQLAWEAPVCGVMRV